MITTILLATFPSYQMVNISFCGEKVKSYPLSNVLAYDAASLATITMLCIRSPKLFICLWKFISFDHYFPISPTIPKPW